MIQLRTDNLNEYLAPLVAALLVFLFIYSTVRRLRKRRTYKYFVPQERRRRLSLVRNGSHGSKEMTPVRTKSFSFANNLTSKNILNNSEMRFFRILSEELPDHYVFPQVSFNALVTHANWIRYLHWQRFVRSKFNTRFVDFVLCRKSDFQVIAVVEYDGGGHLSHHDEHRDAVLRSVGYRIERFTDNDTVETVRARFGLR